LNWNTVQTGVERLGPETKPDRGCERRSRQLDDPDDDSMMKLKSDGHDQKTTRYGLSLKEKKLMKNGIIALFCAILLSFGVAMTASAGSVVDSDGDAVPDLFDNCRNTPNGPFGATGACGTPVQLDSDNDGYGNPCDGDLNQSGFTNGADFTTMFAFLFQSGNAGDLDCSGFTNGVDFTALFGLLFSAPGPGAL
jgi:hypothetical protein